MKKAKIISALAATAIGVSAIGGLTGCSLFGGAKKVSDYDSFMAATGKKAKIELTGDIDFGGAEVEPIALKSLNGNGHTIKNAKVLPGLDLRNATNTGHFISLLGEYTEEVRDVTFDNITINDDGYAKYASFVAAACLEMDNVFVKNSTMTIKDGKYVGGLTCKLKFSSMLNDFETEGSSPTNSGIENSSISTEFAAERVGGICTSGFGTGLYAKNLKISVGSADLVGGLLADGTFENCYVEDCEIYAKSYADSALNPLYVGGLGGTCSSAKNCHVTGTEIKADAPYYGESKVAGIESVATVYAGGIAAYSSYSFDAEYCYSSDNEISVISTGSVYAGGIIGGDDGKGESKITQCYSANNDIEAKGYAAGYRADKYTPQKRNIGGIVGIAANHALSSSFAYGNSLVERSFENQSSVDISYFGKTYMCAGGLVGYKESGVSVSDCAVKSEELRSHNNSNEIYGNDNEAKPDTVYIELTDEQWTDGTTLLDKLKLAADRWTLESGKLPTIKAR